MRVALSLSTARTGGPSPRKEPGVNPHLEPDQSQALQKLVRRFPGTPVWFGHATLHWWALANDRLFEVATAGELELLLDSLQAPQPYEGRPAEPPHP